MRFAYLVECILKGLRGLSIISMPEQPWKIASEKYQQTSPREFCNYVTVRVRNGVKLKLYVMCHIVGHKCYFGGFDIGPICTPERRRVTVGPKPTNLDLKFEIPKRLAS